MRVAYVTEWFAPEVEGIPVSIARTLRDRGLQLGVVTGTPHYPTGRVHAGFRAWEWRLRQHEGLPVLNVPEYPSHDSSALHRLLTYSSFATSAAMLAARTIGRADVCLVYSSPATSALPAMIARARYGTPYVLLIQDLWPESVTANMEMSPAAQPALAALERFLQLSYRWAGHISVISPGMVSLLTARGVPPERISVVPNWVDESLYQPLPRTGALHRKLGLDANDLVLLHAGNLGHAQGLAAWVQAMALLPADARVHLGLLGAGTHVERLQDLVLQLHLERRVHMLPPVPATEVPALLADADAAVVSLRDQALYYATTPSKTQVALAMGRPLLASAPGDVSELVTNAAVGWVARPDDPNAIAAAICKFAASSPSERLERGAWARQLYLDRFGRERGAGALHDRLVECSRVHGQ